MTSLTRTAYISRRVIKYSLIGIVSYVVLQYTVIFGIQLYKQLNPPPPPAPTMGFGPLPRLVFPVNPGYKYNFSLQTQTGSFPFFEDRAVVYNMPYQRANFLAADQAKELATKIGFSSEPEALSAEIFEWRANIPAQWILTTNIVDGSFTLSYQWQSDSQTLNARKLPGRQQTLEEVKQFFNQIDQLPSDINFLEGKITYLKSRGNSLEPAPSLSEAEFVQIDYFRKGIEGLEVLTPDPNKGIIQAIVSSAATPNKRIVAVDYVYYPVDYLLTHTYPLKPVTHAWEELNTGGAYIAKYDGNAETIAIRRVKLAYYDARQAQQHLQPIYVFTGDDGTKNEFIAYVQAVDNTIIKPE